MEEIKYLALNASISLLATAAGIIMMNYTKNYTYLFLVAAVAFIGFRDMVAAWRMYDEK